ncbi:MAG TPA: TetR family transcriptional regulator, partial [Aurantimonas sp.]
MNQWSRISPARTGIEAIRREALIIAAIAAIEEAGSMEATTMAQIAARASVSPALVHHYFGAKDDLMIA